MGWMDEHHVEMTVRLQVGEAHGCLTKNGDPCRSAEAPLGPCVAIDLSPDVNLCLIVILRRNLADRSQKYCDDGIQVRGPIGPDRELSVWWHSKHRIRVGEAGEALS